MNSKYPILSPKDIIKVLLKYEFCKVSQKGSHAKYKNYNSNKVCIIPMHSEIARGTLKKHLRTGRYFNRRFYIKIIVISNFISLKYKKWLN